MNDDIFEIVVDETVIRLQRGDANEPFVLVVKDVDVGQRNPDHCVAGMTRAEVVDLAHRLLLAVEGP